MEKSGLKITAVVVAGLMGVVWMAGFDDLPGDIHKQIAAQRSALSTAQTQIGTAKEEVARGVAGERELFAALPSAALYNERLARSESALSTAARDMEQLARIEKANQRTDAGPAKQLLSHEQQTRTAALAEADAVRKDAAHWIELKKHLPDEVREMERDYQAVHAADLSTLTAAVTKAENDWPEKRADLANRLEAVRVAQSGAEEAWQKSAAARQFAAANETGKVDYAVFFAAADTLHTAAENLPQKTSELKSLAGQLYTSWDKLLVDMRAQKGTYEQKLRTVSTREGVTTSDERWVAVGKPVYQAMERNLGMAVEHKSTGKYDQESERVAQPAGFAYMAAPGQSNQYGHWEHSGGRDFWVFYGQYALMRDLLFNRDYRPLDRREYEDYRTYRQRDQTYYGRDTATDSAPKYGTSGTATQQRYSGSTFSKGGGFKDSKYATQKGKYRDSDYATPAMRDPNGNSSGRTFGNGPSRPSAPRYQPAPRPAPSRPSMPRGPGRTFGSPRRR
jgi:hypothetical protein